jgi:hypothetical protein
MKVWFRDDIARVLMGVNAASHAARSPTLDEAYRDGFVAALISVALVIGISPEAVLLPGDVHSVQRALDSGLNDPG